MKTILLRGITTAKSLVLGNTSSVYKPLVNLQEKPKLQLQVGARPEPKVEETYYTTGMILYR